MARKAGNSASKRRRAPVRRLVVDRSEVSTAFEIVLEEIESVAENLNQGGWSAFQKGDYESARSLIEKRYNKNQPLQAMRSF